MVEGGNDDGNIKPYHARFLARILRSSQFTVGIDKKQCNLTPVVLDTRKYQPVFSEERTSSIYEVPDWELLHAIVGLYDSYLPEITPEVLYNTLTCRSSLTLVFLKEPEDVLKERDREGPKEQKEIPKPQKKEVKGVKAKENKDKKEEEEEEESEDEERIFTGVFSDDETDEEDSSEEETEDDEHYAASVEEYLEQVEKRRKLREQNHLDPASIGAESLLVAAATFKRVHNTEDSPRRDKERIIQLALLAVRRRFRKLGVGRQLLNFVRNPIVVGEYDALVSYVDPGATGFFVRNGFSSDLILNHRFSDLVDHWDNSTLMSYLPPYSECLSSGTVSLLREMSSSLGDDIKRWRSTSVEAYQTQLSCLERMRHEIMLLRTTVSSQETTMNSLTNEIDRLRLSKGVCEREFREYRAQVRAMLSRLKNGKEDLESAESEIMSLSLVGHKDSLVNGHVSENVAVMIGEEEFSDLEDEIRSAICAVPSYKSIRITSIEKQNAEKSALLRNVYKARCNALRDPNMTMKLYYCGGKGGTLHRVLKEGFQPKDMVVGDFGVGMYFTQNPVRAMQYSEPGLLLQCEVGIGNAESVLKMDQTRNRPPVGFDSILTGERDVDHIGIYSHQRHNELQYLVFDSKQAVPLYLIYFTV